MEIEHSGWWGVGEKELYKSLAAILARVVATGVMEE
jgi:hypothetical protein